MLQLALCLSLLYITEIQAFPHNKMHHRDYYHFDPYMEIVPYDPYTERTGYHSYDHYAPSATEQVYHPPLTLPHEEIRSNSFHETEQIDSWSSDYPDHDTHERYNKHTENINQPFERVHPYFPVRSYPLHVHSNTALIDHRQQGVQGLETRNSELFHKQSTRANHEPNTQNSMPKTVKPSQDIYGYETVVHSPMESLTKKKGVHKEEKHKPPHVAIPTLKPSLNYKEKLPIDSPKIQQYKEPIFYKKQDYESEKLIKKPTVKDEYVEETDQSLAKKDFDFSAVNKMLKGKPVLNEEYMMPIFTEPSKKFVIDGEEEYEILMEEKLEPVKMDTKVYKRQVLEVVSKKEPFIKGEQGFDSPVVVASSQKREPQIFNKQEIDTPIVVASKMKKPIVDEQKHDSPVVVASLKKKHPLKDEQKFYSPVVAAASKKKRPLINKREEFDTPTVIETISEKKNIDQQFDAPVRVEILTKRKLDTLKKEDYSSSTEIYAEEHKDWNANARNHIYNHEAPQEETEEPLTKHKNKPIHKEHKPIYRAEPIYKEYEKEQIHKEHKLTMKEKEHNTKDISHPIRTTKIPLETVPYPENQYNGYADNGDLILKINEQTGIGVFTEKQDNAEDPLIKHKQKHIDKKHKPEIKDIKETGKKKHKIPVMSTEIPTETETYPDNTYYLSKIIPSLVPNPSEYYENLPYNKVEETIFTNKENKNEYSTPVVEVTVLESHNKNVKGNEKIHFKDENEDYLEKNDFDENIDSFDDGSGLVLDKRSSGESFPPFDSNTLTLLTRIQEQERDKFKKCRTLKGEIGNCMPVQLCSISNIASSIEELLKNICRIDDVFLGVCCPEFPVERVRVEWGQDQTPNVVFTNSEDHKPAKECGKKENGSSNEDIWPWMTSLISSVSNRVFCGGVLIKEQYVLTAAHCTKKIPHNQILVRLRHPDSMHESPQDFAVIEIKRHANYNSRSMQDDIALLKLSVPVRLGNYRKTICLPDDDKEDYVGQRTSFLRWRRNADEKSRTEILPVIHNEECHRQMGSSMSKFLCTVPRTEETTCNADSGAPLLVENDSTFKVIGVLTWNRNDCDGRFPSIFTRISSYHRWIENHTS